MMHPKTTPAWVKTSLMRTFAIERLRKAAAALLDENAEVARASHRNPMGGGWSDAHWLRADPENAKLCIELRRALKEIDRAIPTQSAKGAEHD